MMLWPVESTFSKGFAEIACQCGECFLEGAAQLIIGGEAGSSRECGVDAQEVEVGVEEAEADRRLVEQAVEQGALGAQLGDQAGSARRATVLYSVMSRTMPVKMRRVTEPGLADGELHRKRRAVFAQADDLANRSR